METLKSLNTGLKYIQLHRSSLENEKGPCLLVMLEF